MQYSVTSIIGVYDLPSQYDDGELSRTTAIGEELFFRGLLLNKFTTLFGGGRWALVLAVLSQAIRFGAGHHWRRCRHLFRNPRASRPNSDNAWARNYRYRVSDDLLS
jgi:hypothetical protein